MPNQRLKRVTLRLHPPVSILHMRALTVQRKPASIPIIPGCLFSAVVTFRRSRIAGRKFSTQILRVKLLNVVVQSCASTGFFLSY